MSCRSKTINFDVKQIGDDRILRFIGSTEHVDRDGDTISSGGWDLKNYKQNPVFLWAHDYSIPPIGRALKVAVQNRKLVFDIEFPAKGIYPFADTIYELYKGGFLNATSVGFVGKEAVPTETGYHYTKQELLELSAVPVPSNPTALQQAKSLGYINEAAAKFIKIGELKMKSKGISINVTPEEVEKMVGDAFKKSLFGETLDIDMPPEQLKVWITEQTKQSMARAIRS
ncbi:HK97 family phage prohead protease [Domibacillus sp. 8LH]|uniref:HK97 family phage prohead protease n=1 Tax=Domibacillus sp. 8LH TaxID=3073900 RepID=UPI003177E3BB